MKYFYTSEYKIGHHLALFIEQTNVFGMGTILENQGIDYKNMFKLEKNNLPETHMVQSILCYSLSWNSCWENVFVEKYRITYIK
jgi:hypothetical protein